MKLVHQIQTQNAALNTCCYTSRPFAAAISSIASSRSLRTTLQPLEFFVWRSKSNSSRNAVLAPRRPRAMISASLQPPLDLTEDNVKLVLTDSRAELGSIFDVSMGMTGVVELAELDGPFVKISLKGRFWHERSLVLARIGNYLKQRIPEILEVEIEDEKQLDDSPENF